MKAGIFVPPFDELAEPAVIAELSARAEERGWDGVFLWDHIVYRDPVRAVADPWVVMAAQACATSTIRLGPLVTPPARRRPWKLARETVSLDRLSGGRLTLGIGLASDRSLELSGFGEEQDDRRRAEVMDEALDVLLQCWSGAPVSFSGTHFEVESKPFLPTPVQRPRPPIWCASRWPARRPLRRAARFEGWFPIELPGPEALADGLQEIAAHRGDASTPFDCVVEGSAGDDPAPWVEAGATWWLTSFGLGTTRREVEDAVDAGPPRA